VTGLLARVSPARVDVPVGAHLLVSVGDTSGGHVTAIDDFGPDGAPAIISPVAS